MVHQVLGPPGLVPICHCVDGFMVNSYFVLKRVLLAYGLKVFWLGDICFYVVAGVKTENYCVPNYRVEI